MLKSSLARSNVIPCCRISACNCRWLNVRGDVAACDRPPRAGEAAAGAGGSCLWCWRQECKPIQTLSTRSSASATTMTRRDCIAVTSLALELPSSYPVSGDHPKGPPPSLRRIRSMGQSVGTRLGSPKRGLPEILCSEPVEIIQAIAASRSGFRIANCARAAFHSRVGRAHKPMMFRSARYSNFVAASSLGK